MSRRVPAESWRSSLRTAHPIVVDIVIDVGEQLTYCDVLTMLTIAADDAAGVDMARVCDDARAPKMAASLREIGSGSLAAEMIAAGVPSDLLAACADPVRRAAVYLAACRLDGIRHTRSGATLPRSDGTPPV